MWLLVLIGSERLDNFYRREEIRPFILVMGSTMVLGRVVTLVSWSWSPEISELALRVTASEPMPPYVYCIGLAGLNITIYYSKGCGIVSLDRSSPLGMSHFL